MVNRRRDKKNNNRNRITIPYGKHCIDKEDIEAVVKVLQSDWITQGPLIEKFEKSLAAYCGAKYAVVASSGTAALHLACLAAGIEIGDEVITSPITFVASANCIIYCRGKPVFSDIDPVTANITPSEIKKRINNNTKALIPVHFAGLPCDMEEINNIAKEHNLIIIEDACHALGAKYKVSNQWIKIGSCYHSDMTVFSFHPVKHITTGEGGAILTNQEELYEKLLLFRNHGITKNDSKFKTRENYNPGQWYYEMQELGFNYRITDFQCALGISQLEKLNLFVARRRQIADKYANRLAELFEYLKIPEETKNTKSSWHLYVVKIKDGQLDRKRLFEYLQNQQIGVQVHYIPVYHHPYYQKIGYSKDLCPKAEQFYSEALSLPIFPKMSEEDLAKVCDEIMNFYKVKK